MLTMIMGFVHLVLMMGVMALTYEYYGKLPMEVPEILRVIVYFGVLGVSVLWALVHALFGSIMGVAAGGIGEGLRMGLTLGLGMSVGRLWPYVLTFSVGAFLCQAEIWHIVASALAGLVCLGVYTSLKFFWQGM